MGNDFQKGFYEEREKIALDPQMVNQFAGGMQGPGLPGQGGSLLPLLKTVGTRVLKGQIAGSAPGHRYASHNPRSLLTQFRY